MKKGLEIKNFNSIDNQQNQQNRSKSKYRSSRSPLSKTLSNIYLGMGENRQTPQAQITGKETFQFKSPKYKGIIEKKILERLDFYEKQNRNKKSLLERIHKSKEHQIYAKQLKSKPEINEIQKMLYQKVREQRNLSPNILERFQTYQLQRANREVQYQLLRTCNFTVNNDQVVCKNILQEKRFNRSKSKSCKNLGYTKAKSPTHVQKLIKTIKKDNKFVKKQFETTVNESRQSYQTYGHDIEAKNYRQPSTISPFKKSNNFYEKDNLRQLILKSQKKQCSPFEKKQMKSNKWYTKPL